MSESDKTRPRLVMHKIPKARFDALASFARASGSDLLGEELAWFASAGEEVLAVAIRDIDGEFSAQLLARDQDERYRSVAGTGFHTQINDFMADLRALMAATVANYEEIRVQGDESGKAVELFTPIRSKRLHTSFQLLATNVGFSAARQLISELMRWYDDVDGNFIEQFQTTGFDQRIWELYLFATFKDVGLDVNRPDPAPDFLVTGPGVRFAVEAMSINPTDPGGSTGVNLQTQPDHDSDSYRRDYLPVKYAGPLTAKLGKKYWTRPDATGIPLVFAIQDFHDERSMSFTGSALPTYLYGYDYRSQTLANGSTVVVPVKITEHQKGNSTVPSGFFFHPEAEHVSAVIFNSRGTIAKFNRMGVLAGFGSLDVTLLVEGFRVDPSPGAVMPVYFSQQVDSDYAESWIDGMDVYHNPQAAHPLEPGWLPGATHHHLKPDGSVFSVGPVNRVFGSTTYVVGPSGSES